MKMSQERRELLSSLKIIQDYDLDGHQATRFLGDRQKFTSYYVVFSTGMKAGPFKDKHHAMGFINSHNDVVKKIKGNVCNLQ